MPNKIFNFINNLSFCKKLFLLFILILSFRLWYGFYSNSFGQDGARDLILMESKINKNDWLVGYGPKASVGDFYLPPLYYQVHLVLSFLSANNPFVMKFFVIFIESATPIFLVLLFSELGFINQRWVVAFLYGLMPIPTIFGSFAWNPNTIPFFSTLALYSWVRIIKVLTSNKGIIGWEPIVGLLSVAISVHFHYQAVIIIPFALMILVWSFWKNISSRKYWVIGILLSLLTLFPYILIEIENSWNNTNQIINYFTGEHSRYYDRVSKPDYLLTFFPSFFERVLTGTNFYFLYFGRLIFFIGGITLFIKSIGSRKNNILHLYLGIYFFLLLIVLRFYKGDKLDYYLSTLYIFPSFLLVYLFEKYKKIFFIVILFIIFHAGFYYGKIKAKDGYGDLKSSVSFIANEINRNEVRYIFYNNDDINTYIYGLEKIENLKINKDSLFVVEICDQARPCIWNGELICVHSRAYTYASLIKSSGEYLNKSFIKTNDKKTILIGEFKVKPNNSHYRLYSNDLSYGTDTIYSSFYEE